MRDLEIANQLIAGTAGGDALATICELPIGARAPFLAGIIAYTRHPSSELRAVALRALAGASGMIALRAIVGALDDDDPGVRDAALSALRESARDTPDRYAHAVFHPRREVRRASFVDPPGVAADLGCYLRADPECVDLAVHAPWPRDSLALALDMYGAALAAPRELVAVLANQSNGLAGLVREQRRTDDQVAAFLHAAAAADRLAIADGHDALDDIVEAIDLAGTPPTLTILANAIADRPTADRLVVAILSRCARLATACTARLLELCVAAEPRIIGWRAVWAVCGAGFGDAAVSGLFRYQWPSKLGRDYERLFAVEHVKRDLALAAAVVGLAGTACRQLLVRELGEATIVESLSHSDRGWDEICRLPPEQPAIELEWLARLSPSPRFVQLAGRSLALYRADQLTRFIEWLPADHRAPALDSLLQRGDLDGAAKVAKIAHIGPYVGHDATLVRRAIARGDVAQIIVELLRSLAAPSLLATIDGLDDDALATALAAVDHSEGLPRSREVVIAKRIASRCDPRITAWVTKVITPPPPPIATPMLSGVRQLTEAERYQIAAADPRMIDAAIEIARGQPTRGVVAAVAEREPRPSPAVCAALFGSVDPIDAVATQLDRFAALDDERFDDRIDFEVVASWQRASELPPLCHARLFRWEAHAAAFARWIDDTGGIRAALSAAGALPGRVAIHTLWRAIADRVLVMRHRDRAALAAEGPEALARYCIERLDRPIGAAAAKIVVALIEGRLVPIVDVRDRLLAAAAEATRQARELLARVVPLDGMPPPTSTDRSRPLADANDLLLETIRLTRDVDPLIAWCRSDSPPIVAAAVAALLALGAIGQRALASLLGELATLAVGLPITDSVARWDDGAALATARGMLAIAALPAHWRYRIAVALAEWSIAIAAAREPLVGPSWFSHRDWNQLATAIPHGELARLLIGAPHYHAYAPAIEWMLALAPHDEARRAALIHFLDIGRARPVHSRRAAAVALLIDHGDGHGIAVVIDQLVRGSVDDRRAWIGALRASDPNHLAVICDGLCDAALIGGRAVYDEVELVDALARLGPSLLGHRERCARILELAKTTSVRRYAAGFAISDHAQGERVRSVAEVFAWGIRRGLELTSRVFRVHVTASESDYGHTRLETSRIFVTALPLLRGELYGRDIVEGLLLHELGHHAFHRDRASDHGSANAPQAIWRRAHRAGLGRLLNLIADEHLERNLRAIDASYGDRLKRLDAYAFHHAAQELPVATLVRSLRRAAAPALIATRLEVAFDDQSVRLSRGAVLGELERLGHPLARFARALRMGLGNRHRDPVVEQALALCGRDLRKRTMAELYELTEQVAGLFGGAVALADAFGGPEDLGSAGRDEDVFGNLDDDILQREIERILDPRRGHRRTDAGESRLTINVSSDEAFERITTVERIRPDRARHRAIAHDVERHARRLRSHLEELGLRWEPQRARLRGRAIDRGQLEALVTRGEPRILIARERIQRSDLFLATIVDCSGSMSAGHHIDRAVRFAVLVAEAVRPLAGVEARFFGFTDSVIYDAGDSHDCAVASLVADGGNNDAAALLHAAEAAERSRKRARVLLMISDGLPTECSVAALRGLVARLSRRHRMICAQVAVHPLEEVCFPHHVLLDGDNLEAAVARFGQLIGDLARRALAS